MGNEDKELRAELSRSYGKVVFATLPSIGLCAFRKPTGEEYRSFLTEKQSGKSGETMARENLVMACMVHPTEKKRAREVIRRLPVAIHKIFPGVESLGFPEVDDEYADKVDPAELEKARASGLFGMLEGVNVEGLGPVLLVNSDSAAALTREMSDGLHSDKKDFGDHLWEATLSFVAHPSREAVEAYMAEWPGLMMVLWPLCQKLSGDEDVELGKG